MLFALSNNFSTINRALWFKAYVSRTDMASRQLILLIYNAPIPGTNISRPFSNESISSCSVKWWIRLTTRCTVLGTALRCLMAIKSIGRAIEDFFCFKCYCALLGEMLDSFDP